MKTNKERKENNLKTKMPNQTDTIISIAENNVIITSSINDTTDSTSLNQNADQAYIWAIKPHETFWKILETYQKNPYLDLTTFPLIKDWWVHEPQLGKGASTVFQRTQNNSFPFFSETCQEMLIFRQNCLIWDCFEKIDNVAVHVRRTCWFGQIPVPKIELRLAFVSEKNNLNIFHKTMSLVQANLQPWKWESSNETIECENGTLMNVPTINLKLKLKNQQFQAEKNCRFSNYLPLTTWSETLSWIGGTVLNVLSTYWLDKINLWTNPQIGAVARYLNFSNNFLSPIVNRQYRSIKANCYRKALHTMQFLLSGTSLAANLLENYALNGDTLTPEQQNKYMEERPPNWAMLYFLYFNSFGIPFTIAAGIDAIKLFTNGPFYQNNHQARNWQASISTTCDFFNNSLSAVGYLSLLAKTNDIYRGEDSPFQPINEAHLKIGIPLLFAEKVLNLNSGIREFAALNKDSNPHYYCHETVLKAERDFYCQKEFESYYQFEQKHYEKIELILIDTIFNQIENCETISKSVKVKLEKTLFLNYQAWLTNFENAPEELKSSLTFKKNWIKQQATALFAENQALIKANQTEMDYANPPNYYLIPPDSATTVINQGASTSQILIEPTNYVLN